jgi:hypothetical protein
LIIDLGIKKAPSTGAVENGSVANIEDEHSFHNKLVGAVIIINKKSNTVSKYRNLDCRIKNTCHF